MGDQLEVDPAVLQQAADGITAIIGELSELGTGETGAAGRGFSLLTLSSMEAGKQSVQQAFETFTERWSWGIRALVQAGNAIAETLGLAAGRYHILDEEFSGTFKQMYTHLIGNPHLSREEIESRSWSDTLADNGFNHIRNADYSEESFHDAWTNISDNATLLNEIKDMPVSGSPIPGLVGWNTGIADRAAQIRAEQGDK